MSADENSVSAPGGDSAPFNEKAVFVAALALKPAEQEAFLQGACPGDAERTRVRTLLERHAEASTEGLRAKAELADTGARVDVGQDQLIAELELPCRIGDFELRREVGRGGMGVVYLARDLTLERDVAVKMLEPRYGASAKFLASFKQEAVLASQLRHPAIVPVFRFGDHKGTPFIVTPYIEGETLRERLCVFDASPASASDARAWRREVAGVLATIAEALDRAHAEGIVHRDVKPSNIIIDGAGRPHLLDFGISMRAGDGESLLPTAQMGSSAYASPEQLAGGSIDGLSDVYSLGIVLFECLTTQRPFDHADRAADRKHPVTPHARRIDRTIPADLDVICHKAMTSARDDRYQSAAHIAADLRAWLADRPILARPDPMPRRVRRWVGRHRAAVLSGVAAAVTLVATAIGFWIAQDPRPRLILEGVPEDARIVVQPLTVPLGSLDGDWSEVAVRTRLEPGWYRILVASTDGTQAEFSRWLAPDTTTRLVVRPVDRAVAIDGMIRIDPAIDQPHPSSIDFPGFSYRFTESYWIDRHEVSNAQYEAFVLDRATDVPPPPYWNGQQCPEHLRDLPVVGITWPEARAYAEWAGKRLPTIAEWLHAAIGSEGRRYPTSDAVDSAADLGVLFDEAAGMRAAGFAAHQTATTAAVWSKYESNVRFVSDAGGPVADRTPEGLVNLYGNVREWTDSLPFHEDGEAVARLVMGFCWEMPGPEPDTMLVADEQAIEHRIIGTGFRCARSASVSFEYQSKETP